MGVKLIALKPKLFKGSVFLREYEKEAKAITNGVHKDYRKAVSKWRRKPKFKKRVEFRDIGIIMAVTTDNKIFLYWDEGTKKHIIRPRRREFLRFIGSSYRARSAPRGRGRPRKSDYVYTKMVKHPGFKGTKTSQKIRKRWGPRVIKKMDRATKRAAKKSGHAIK